MIWRRQPRQRWNMRLPPRFLAAKALVLLFFTVLVLAPFTGWLLSLPMWAMDVLGYLLSPAASAPATRWFAAGMALAGVPSLGAVGWRAWRERDLDAGVMGGVAAVVWLVLLFGLMR